MTVADLLATARELLEADASLGGGDV